MGRGWETCQGQEFMEVQGVRNLWTSVKKRDAPDDDDEYKYLSKHLYRQISNGINLLYQGPWMDQVCCILCFLVVGTSKQIRQIVHPKKTKFGKLLKRSI